MRGSDPEKEFARLCGHIVDRRPLFVALFGEMSPNIRHARSADRGDGLVEQVEGIDPAGVEPDEFLELVRAQAALAALTDATGSASPYALSVRARRGLPPSSTRDP